MRSDKYVHLSNHELLHRLSAAVAEERVSTTTLIELIAEVDRRRLYAEAGYSSMHAYCVHELHLSDDAAFKRIRAARAGRKFPVLFDMLAAGQVHLAAVYLIAPYMTPENADELLRLVTGKRKREVEELLMRRFPSREPASWVRPIVVMAPRPICGAELAPGPVPDAESSRSGREGPVPEPIADRQPGEPSPNELAPGPAGAASERSSEEKVIQDSVEEQPTAPVIKRYLLHFTVGESTHEKLRYIQALLSHAVPSNDVAQVFDRALDALKEQVEKQRLGSDRPSRKAAKAGVPTKIRDHAVACESGPAKKRYIPVSIRHAVWKRDRGQCTFVSTGGKRCNARRFLEFDHIEPVARGGTATVDGIRLRCRTHNQLEAERIFGKDFMDAKRRVSQLAAWLPPASAGVRRGG